MTTISNNTPLGLQIECTACKYVEVELTISLGKLVRGASPQDVGHHIMTRMQRKAKDTHCPQPACKRGWGQDYKPKLSQI